MGTPLGFVIGLGFLLIISFSGSFAHSSLNEISLKNAGCNFSLSGYMPL